MLYMCEHFLIVSLTRFQWNFCHSTALKIGPKTCRQKLAKIVTCRGRKLAGVSAQSRAPDLATETAGRSAREGAGDVPRPPGRHRVAPGSRIPSSNRRNLSTRRRGSEMHTKVKQECFFMKKAYHSTSNFLVYNKYGCHCLPKLFILNLPMFICRVLWAKCNVQEGKKQNVVVF
jgi:hypothetical protein